LRKSKLTALLNSCRNLLGGMLLVLPGLAAAGVSAFEFDRFSDQLGGRQSTVYDIFEDQQGFLWFAGDTDGLLRYDGYELMSWSEGFVASEIRHNVSTQIITRDGRLWVGSWGNGLQYWEPEQQRFVQFLSDSAQSHGLADNRVQSLLEDSSGRVWIGTVAGLNYIDPDQPELLRRFLLDQPDHPLHAERIWGLVEVDGLIWLATSSGVYRLDEERAGWQRWELLAGLEVAEHERSDEVRTVAWAHGRVWAASQLGAFHYDPDLDEFRRAEFLHDPERPMPRVNEFIASSTHGVLAGAHDGLYRIDPDTTHFRPFGDDDQLLPDVDVRALHEDAEGHLWIGTRDQGMIYGRRQQQTFLPLARTMPEPVAEHGQRLASAVTNDRAGRLWVSFPGGVLRWNQDDSWKEWRFDARDGVRRIERMAEDELGWMWLATDGGLFVVDADDELRAETGVFDRLGLGVLPVSELWVEPGGCLWIALWHHGLVCWDRVNDRFDLLLTELQQTRGDSVYQLSADANGRLWVATRYAGLFSVDLADRQLRRWSLGGGERHDPSWYCAVPDGNRLWLCSEDGLILFDPERYDRQRFSVEYGLPAARIFGFFTDASGGRWALTPNGIARQLPGRDRFVSFALADGLPGLGLQRNAVTLDRFGRLVVGTNRGAAVLQDPTLPSEYRAPRVVLSRAWLGREDVTRRLNPASPEIRLAADQRDLLLQFAVLDFHDSAGSVMRLKLEGLDDEFGPLTTDRSVRYVNLAPGRYRLLVEGWNSRGVQVEQALSLSIVVEAPWWQSPWVGFAALMLLLGIAWLLVHLRFRSMRSTNTRLQSMVDERTQALAEVNDQLRAQSSQDFLTGLLNRRGFTDRFEQLRRMRRQSRRPLSLILFDLDFFKELNDRHGHDAGDRVLRRVAEILSEMLPYGAFAGRWGGEEFLIALDGSSADDAEALCQELRVAFKAAPVEVEGQVVTYSATFGVASSLDSGATLEEWTRRVDRALYQGKRSGRDRIQVDRPES
jgi:diguanylate cyclase (GGDEF)-like protein